MTILKVINVHQVATVSYAGVIALLLIVRGRHNDISHRLYPGTLHLLGAGLTVRENGFQCNVTIIQILRV